MKYLRSLGITAGYSEERKTNDTPDSSCKVRLLMGVGGGGRNGSHIKRTMLLFVSFRRLKPDFGRRNLNPYDTSSLRVN